MTNKIGFHIGRAKMAKLSAKTSARVRRCKGTDLRDIRAWKDWILFLKLLLLHLSQAQDVFSHSNPPAH